MINDDSDGYFSDFHCSPNSDIYAGNCKIEPMSNDPFIQILEQPGDFRYRYEKERYHGYILGQSSPPTKRKDLSKYPSVKICNYDSDVIIRCWLISADINESSKAHFHKLARKLPKGEMKLEPHESRASRKNGYEVTFDYMYIVHAVEKEQKDLDIYENKKRWLESSSYDPPPKSSNAEIDRVELKNLDKNQSILLFEAFDAETKEKICESSISRKIKNLHNPETASLKIVNYSKTSGSPRGGDEVFMFFEKISKDVEIKFFSDYSGGRWEAKALYNNQNIHHQCAIVFKTPPFYDQNISSPTPVFIELFRKTDGAKSEPVPFTYQPDAYCSYNNFARKRPHSPEPVISDSKDDPLISLGASPKRNKEHFDHGQMPEILSPQTIEELFLSYEIDTLNDSETIPCKVEHTGWHTELETIPESKDILSNMTWIGEDNKPLQDVQLDYLDYLPHFTLFSNSQIQSDSAIKIVQANSSEDEEDVTEKVKIKSKTTKNSDRNTKLGNDKNSQEDDDKVDSGVKKVSKKPQAGMGIREMGIRSSPRKNVLKSAMKEVNLCNNLLADVKIQTDYVTSDNLSDDENRVIPQVADHIAEAQGPEFSLYSPPEFKVMRINKNQPIEDCDELPVINPVSPTDWERLPSKVNNTAPLGIPEDIRILKFLCSYITDETSDKLSTLEFILWKKRNFDINTADFGGNSLFLIACSRSIRIASFLLRYIEEVNLQMTNLDGDNALLCASRAGRLDIVELLLHNRFDANVHNYKSGDTPLHIAVDSENIPLIKLLIKHGGNPLMNNFASESPYDYSTLSQNNGLKKYLYLKAQERFGKRRIRPTSDYFSCENINSQMQCLKVS